MKYCNTCINFGHEDVKCWYDKKHTTEMNVVPREEIIEARPPRPERPWNREDRPRNREECPQDARKAPLKCWFCRDNHMKAEFKLWQGDLQLLKDNFER